MKKQKHTILSALFIAAVIFWIFFAMVPQWISRDNAPLDEYSSKRALVHVAAIAEKPHYVSSRNHEEVLNYLQKELQNLGLETEIQEGTTFSDWGSLVKSKNLLARIKGSSNTKALMLLSHYDSAPHSSSYGAADDASGVATILEGLRTFLHKATPHKNDIIILFSDAEELGLNGAALFATRSTWAKDVGVVVNFEARGTAGPSYMLMEVNGGNSAMVDAFSQADANFPVANSLMYSIYKMLPNDTDLTVFREQGKIQGFNFAFIDDHFNYHTAQDDIAHLDQKSLAHQGSYLMPLLNYFADANLDQLNSTDDQVYFSLPYTFLHYPFSWNFPILIIATVLFIIIVIIGIGRRTLIPREIGRGFIVLLATLLSAGAITYIGYKILLLAYPHYNEILHGFTYNGHAYILAFVFLSLAISFLFYKKTVSQVTTLSYTVAPILLWLLINIAVAFLLPGAGFLIIPIFCSLLMLAFFVLAQRSNTLFNLLISVPILILIVPFIWMFPIGLGLKVLFGSSILTVIVFALMLPVFGFFSRKTLWSAAMFLISIGFFVYAHLNSNFEYGTSKPNSLVYFYDVDKKSATWATYDNILDPWTSKYLGISPASASAVNTNLIRSKYQTPFSYSAPAPIIDLATPDIEFLQDSVVGKQRYLKIRILSNRKVNKYDLFVNPKIKIHNLVANGARMVGEKGATFKSSGKNILSYYVVDNEPLILQFSVDSNVALNLELLESSFDLLENSALKVDRRRKNMMPKPFVLNDAVILKLKIKPTVRRIIPELSVPVLNPALPIVTSDSLLTHENQPLTPQN